MIHIKHLAQTEFRMSETGAVTATWKGKHYIAAGP
jgi:hypothetical protein